MSRSLFTNPKAALAFAGATLVGAVAMVGTSDQHGVLPAVVEQIEARSDYGSGEPEVAQPPRPTRLRTDRRCRPSLIPR